MLRSKTTADENTAGETTGAEAAEAVKTAADAAQTAADAAEKSKRAAAAVPERKDVDTQTSGAAAENHKGTMIYVGASLPGIKSNTALTGTVPAKLNVPFIRELVIPIEDFTGFLKKKAQAGSREDFCYRKSVEYAGILSK